MADFPPKCSNFAGPSYLGRLVLRTMRNQTARSWRSAAQCFLSSIALALGALAWFPASGLRMALVVDDDDLNARISYG